MTAELTGTVQLPGPADFERLRHSRATDPGAIRRALATRVRRPLLGDDGRLFIVAADHAARGALAVRDDAMTMGDRYGLLSRLALALSRPGVDGVLGTPDVIDDLAALGLLDDKVVVGSMNRGGLRGASFEMDDRFTGYDVPSVVRDRLDFAKALLRIDLADTGTVATMHATAGAVSAAATANVPIMLEPFMSVRRDGRIVNDLTTDAVITSVAIAAGLGTSSTATWLKLPVVPAMDRVMAATTLPTLLLGGDPPGHPEATYASWRAALALPGVRGIVAGRAILYPPDGDVRRAIDRTAELVHGLAVTRP